jgi:hypothetical protein
VCWLSLAAAAAGPVRVSLQRSGVKPAGPLGSDEGVVPLLNYLDAQVGVLQAPTYARAGPGALPGGAPCARGRRARQVRAPRRDAPHMCAATAPPQPPTLDPLSPPPPSTLAKSASARRRSASASSLTPGRASEGGGGGVGFVGGGVGCRGGACGRAGAPGAFERAPRRRRLLHSPTHPPNHPPNHPPTHPPTRPPTPPIHPTSQRPCAQPVGAVHPLQLVQHRVPHPRPLRQQQVVHLQGGGSGLAAGEGGWGRARGASAASAGGSAERPLRRAALLTHLCFMPTPT